MADTTETTQPEARPEVMQRVTKERDEARAQLAEATSALEDVQLLNRAYDHFRQTDIPNAYDVANVAKDAIKGVEPDKVGEALSAWYERQSALFNVPSEAQPLSPEPASPPSEPPPPSAFNGPNPAAPSGRTGTEVVVMAPGNERWNAWRKGKSQAEIRNAINSGELVVSDQVRKAHDTFA